LCWDITAESASLLTLWNISKLLLLVWCTHVHKLYKSKMQNQSNFRLLPLTGSNFFSVTSYGLLASFIRSCDSSIKKYSFVCACERMDTHTHTQTHTHTHTHTCVDMYKKLGYCFLFKSHSPGYWLVTEITSQLIC